MYEEETSPSNYIPTFLKYKWYALTASVIIFAIIFVIVVALPPIYRSSGKVLVETQQIPTDLVKSTVTTVAQERIEVIKQRIMTRDRLLNIIRKYDFFVLPEDSPSAELKQLNYVRDSVDITVVQTGGSRRGDANAIVFDVAFESAKPSIAQAIANDLVTLFLSENLKIRTERASETTEFLKAEARKVKQELDANESAIAELKQNHKDSLPEHLNIYVDMRERSQTRLSEIKRDMRIINEEIRYESANRESTDNTDNANSPSARLKQLKAELSQALLSYTPQHPDVVELKQQINTLERLSLSGGSNDSEFTNLAASGSEQRIAKLRSDLSSLNKEHITIEEKIADLEERILKIPQVERSLASLSREIGLKNEMYSLLMTKSREAEIAESLEEGKKSERFSIIEPPIYPLEPVKPDRLKLLIAGAAASLGLPLGILFILGFLNKNIIGSRGLSKVVDSNDLFEVPYIISKEEIERRRGLTLFMLGAGVLLILFTALVMDILVMPLAEIIPKAIDRIL